MTCISNVFLRRKCQVRTMITMTFDASWIEFAIRYIVDCRLRGGVKDKLCSAIFRGI